MKFKVGDKVKFVGDYNNHKIYYKKRLKDFVRENENILYIAKVSSVCYQVKGAPFWCFKEDELVRIDYTYEDLKKAPIGTKVTFENGEKLIKCSVKRYENENRWRDEKDFVRMEDKFKTLGKITKIEEPTYQTVFETKVDILDEAEKRYLKQVIRPYKDVKSIQKYIFFDKKLAKIQIFVLDIRGTGCWAIDLPPFKKDTMYKNMEDNKDYTLEELGL